MQSHSAFGKSVGGRSFLSALLGIPACLSHVIHWYLFFRTFHLDPRGIPSCLLYPPTCVMPCLHYSWVYNNETASTLHVWYPVDASYSPVVELFPSAPQCNWCYRMLTGFSRLNMYIALNIQYMKYIFVPACLMSLRSACLWPECKLGDL